MTQSRRRLWRQASRRTWRVSRKYAGLTGAGGNVSQAISADDQKAASLVLVRKKPAPSGFGGGGGGRAANVDPAEASRQQYNAMEMRGFADGKRSVLEIRNALSAEYGPQNTEKVLAFFEGLAKTGEFELVEMRGEQRASGNR